MMHSTHKAHIRQLKTDLAFKVAARLAAGNIPFVFETIATTRCQEAYLSCNFESTLDTAINLVSGAALGVASNTEESEPCPMPQGHPARCGCEQR